jgi:hypothetical protein
LKPRGWLAVSAALDLLDPNWDIKRGADVLNVQWLERVDADAHPLIH